MTVWSGAFRLAGTATSLPLEARLAGGRSTSAAPSPMTAAMAPARALPASSISSPRRRTMRAPSVGVSAPGGDVRAVLAEAVPGGGDHRPQPAAHDREHGAGVREDRGLRVVREGELFLRALPT